VSFGFKPSKVTATGGVNGIKSTAKARGAVIRVGLNGTGEILARA